jgi:hypothetical protein
MAAGGGSSRNKATVSTAHSVCVCVCVCVNASVLVSLPLLSALDETKKITVTEERSHGWMKKLL